MRSVELFAGAGGLALGGEIAGLHPQAIIEWDKWACDTIRNNAASDYPLVRNWNVHEGDVRAFDWTSLNEPVDIVTGGPPCQPFSMGGKAAAADDPRDMFPAATDVVRQVRPRAFVFENVRGLTRSSFSNYFQYVQLRLSHPELTCRASESWIDHFHRLQAEHTSVRTDLKYNVTATLVNAADYGVPQQRHRVFLIGFRSDVDAEWSFPSPTHSRSQLIRDKWLTGEYWERHQVRKTERVSSEFLGVAGLSKRNDSDTASKAWRTVRDAIGDLPAPKKHQSPHYLNHLLQMGARSYPGHTGSPIDLPAKTLKAGDHGVPGGENMLRRANGAVRYFTIREAARLQTFPDGYELHGSWTEAMRQLGNAVPVLLGQIVLASVVSQLSLADAKANNLPIFAPPRLAASA